MWAGTGTKGARISRLAVGKAGVTWSLGRAVHFSGSWPEESQRCFHAAPHAGGISPCLVVQKSKKWQSKRLATLSLNKCMIVSMIVTEEMRARQLADLIKQVQAGDEI